MDVCTLSNSRFQEVYQSTIEWLQGNSSNIGELPKLLLEHYGNNLEVVQQFLDYTITQQNSNQEKNKLSKKTLKELIRIKNNLIKALGITEQKIIPGLQLNFTEIHSSFVQFNIDQNTSKSIVSPEISTYIYETLQRYITEFSIINLNSDKPKFVNKSTLNNSIDDFQRTLVHSLYNFLRSEGVNISTKGDYIDYRRKIIETAWSILQQKIGGNLKLDVAINSVTLKKLINPLIFIITLNNFDEIVKNLASDRLVINQELFGKEENYGLKYSYIEQTIKNSSFEGSFSDASYDRSISKVLSKIMSIIPDGKGGYCSIRDLQAITKHLQTLASVTPEKKSTGLSAFQDIDTQLYNYKLLFDNSIPFTQKFDLLKNILQNDKDLKEKFKDSIKLEQIADYLQRLRDALENSINAQSEISLEDKMVLSTHYNIGEQFIANIVNAHNLAYLQVTETGYRVNSNSLVRKNKAEIQQKLKDTLYWNILSIGRIPNEYNSRYIIPGSRNTVLGYRDIFNKTFLDHIRYITGFQLELPVYQEIMNKYPEECANIIGRFLHIYKELIYKYINNDSLSSEAKFNEAVRNIFDELIRWNEYTEFTDLLTIENSQDHTLLYDQSLHTQPSQGSATTIGEYTQNIMTYLTQRDKLGVPIEEGNIFIKYPQLRANYDQYSQSRLSDIFVFRQDTILQDQVVQGNKLSAAELTTQAINYEFLQPILKDGKMFAQVDCVSDKIRIPLGTIDTEVILPYNKEGQMKSLSTFTVDQLFELYHKQHSSYYLNIERKIIADYNTLFSKKFSNIDEVIKFIESQKNIEALIYAKLKELEVKNTHLEIYPQIHYYKNGFNTTLYYHIKAAHDINLFKAIITENIKYVKSYIIDNNIPIIKKSFQIDKAADKLYRFIGENVDQSKIQEYCNLKKNETPFYTQNPEHNKISDIIIYKYVLLSQLVSEADLQLSGKMEFIHNGKQAALNLKQETINIDDILRQVDSRSLSDLLESKDSFEDSLSTFQRDQSERLKVSKKRYNSLVAARDPVRVDGKYQMPRIQRVAHIKPHEKVLYNFNGDPKHNQATNDGAIFGNGIMDIIESWSYGDKDYSTNSQKIIGIIPNYMGITQIKTAKYSINNERIRNSFHAEGFIDSDHYDFYKLFKKINNFKLDDNFIENIENLKNSRISNQELWYSFNGRVAFLNGVSVNEGKIIATWVYENSDEVVDPELVAECMDLKLTKVGDTFIGFDIETVFDLWKLFGGCDSGHLNKYGELEYDEQSMQRTALLICEASPLVKSKLIAKLLDTESVKSGQCNVNTKEDVLDENTPLLYQEVESDRFGIQQDYTHEMLDCDIPLLTQALSGVALNGKTTKEAQIIYESLADVINTSLQSIQDYFNSNDEQKLKFKIRLAQDLWRNLQTSSVKSSASKIVYNTIQSIQEYLKNPKNNPFKGLPLSDRNIFSKVTTDMIVALNNSGIRQRFNGIAVIQNPSHGVIGVYEDRNGEVYTYKDLIDEIDKINQVQPIYTGSIQERIQEFLKKDDRFGLEAVNNDNLYKLTIGSIISIADEDSNLKTIEILDPDTINDVLERYNSGQIIYFNHSIKRDLKTRQITFKDEFEWKNLWTIQSTKYILFKNGQLDKRYLTEEKIQEVNSLSKEEILEYHRANYDTLSKQQAGYYATYKDFRKGILTEVSDIKLSSGEQIIPNVNRNKQGIIHTVHKVKSEGYKYFEDEVYTRYEKTHDIEPTSEYKDDIQVTAITYDSEIVISNNLNLSSLKEATLLEENGKYYITDIKGNKLFQVPGDRKYFFDYYTLSNGKTLYIIKVEKKNIQEDLTEINSILDNIDNINIYYNDKNFNSARYRNKANGITFNPNEDVDEFNNFVEEQCIALYNSFLLTLKTISTRIPSQSWQSFLATETVAFTENDKNDGYMNIWEMWMQGSDFDIK